jgi:hypothetical protein
MNPSDNGLKVLGGFDSIRFRFCLAYFRASRADLIASQEVLASPNSILVPGMKNIGLGTSAR